MWGCCQVENAELLASNKSLNGFLIYNYLNGPNRQAVLDEAMELLVTSIIKPSPGGCRHFAIVSKFCFQIVYISMSFLTTELAVCDAGRSFPLSEAIEAIEMSELPGRGAKYYLEG